ncbi:YbaB/EbfC family nucleoid-associated protein [Actinophytocola gossypii]|uniref:YbaB/EbfC family nucleoid-associated protein n=1 Tax=Actinophytocola gossypii TaxID=2812003 RepID=A0ABT2J4X7_9PSEU|nr:YbaB/EbfC family nucleoid-associated protein [Actinophytocola gossypii]MCT2582843.1 YbaB/EbfC family nucleoid-associated protein [Actinophytocola gossypii]
MTGDEQVFLDAAERLRGAAERAGTTPFDYLRNGFSGRSADGSVTVWVDALGRVRDTTIRQGTLLEGDEQRVAAAFTEAAKAAAEAARDLLTPEGPHPDHPAEQTTDDVMVKGVFDPRSSW